MPPTGDLASHPGMCPDWELNQQPLGLQPMFNPLSYTSQGLLLFSLTVSIHFYFSFLVHCIPSYNSIQLPGIIFVHSEKLSVVFLIMQFFWQFFHFFFPSETVFISSSLFWRVFFIVYRILRCQHLLSALQDVVPLSSEFNSFCWKLSHQSYCCTSEGNTCFFLCF